MSSIQHACTKGKPVETALHSLVVTVERALHIKKYALGVFVDISGAFNNVNHVITDPAILLWIGNLLSCGRLHSEWGTASMVKGAHRGTPQGGVLSPLLLKLVVDDLIKRFKMRASKITDETMRKQTVYRQ